MLSARAQLATSFSRCRQNQIRQLSNGASTLSSHALMFDAFGSPSAVLRLGTSRVPAIPPADRLLVRMLASPVNPSDINQIQGVYPIRPDVPNAVAGNEGVAEIVAVGADLAEQGWRQGDRVVPNTACFGTWRTYAQARPQQLLKVPKDVPLELAATITVNPFSAYRMLADYHKFEGDDMVILNSANSGVGRAVLQLAKLRNIPTVAVVRDRPDLAQLSAELSALGATHVVTEEFLRSKDGRGFAGSVLKDRVALALNGVGGKSAVDIARCVRPGGQFVTYGNMSRDPLTIPASLFIFNDLHCHGFWMARWKDRHAHSAEGLSLLKRMLDDIVEAVRQGKFHAPPVETVEWSGREKDALERFLGVLKRSQEPFVGRKQLLRFIYD